MRRKSRRLIPRANRMAQRTTLFLPRHLNPRRTLMSRGSVVKRVGANTFLPAAAGMPRPHGRGTEQQACKLPQHGKEQDEADRELPKTIWQPCMLALA